MTGTQHSSSRRQVEEDRCDARKSKTESDSAVADAYFRFVEFPLSFFLSTRSTQRSVHSNHRPSQAKRRCLNRSLCITSRPTDKSHSRALAPYIRAASPEQPLSHHVRRTKKGNGIGNKGRFLGRSNHRQLISLGPDGDMQGVFIVRGARECKPVLT